MEPDSVKFDVAVSFAGENRAYAGAVLDGLKAAGASVFYDQDEAVGLWGEDLAVALDDIYRRRSRYVVVFVSREYAIKVWTRHEFRSALARTVEERGAYILPIRLDDAELDGLRPTVAYLDGRRLTPADIVQSILAKLGKTAGSSTIMTDRPVRLPKRAPVDFDPYAEAERAIEHLKSELTARANSLRREGITISTRDRGGRFGLRVLLAGRLVYVFEVWLGEGREAATLCFSDGHREPTSPSSMTATAAPVWDKGSNRVVLRGTNFSLLRGIGAPLEMTGEELVDEIWNKLCDVVERAE